MSLNFDDGAKYMDLVCEMAKVGQSRIINFEILGKFVSGWWGLKGFNNNNNNNNIVIVIIIIIIIIIINNI